MRSIHRNLTKAAALCAAVLVLAGGATANAAPLGLSQAFPDIAADGISTNYNASSDAFTVNGSVFQYTEADGSTTYNAIGTYEINATIAASGDFVSGNLWVGVPNQGTGAEDGAVFDSDPATGDGSSRVTLLTGTLTDFGYSGTASSTIFEFVGTLTGGALQADFEATADQFGIILDPRSASTIGSGFSGHFESDFSHGGSGAADTFAVPEPASATFLIGSAGLALLGGSSRRKRRAVEGESA